jgi:hypothetical protein
MVARSLRDFRKVGAVSGLISYLLLEDLGFLVHVAFVRKLYICFFNWSPSNPPLPPSATTTALDMKAASPPGHSKNKRNEIQQNPRAPKTTNPLEKELNRGLNPLNFFSIR